MSAGLGERVRGWLRRGSHRLTARLRLTLFYSGLFVLCAACLLAVPYLLIRSTPAGTISYDRADHTYTYIGASGLVIHGQVAVAPHGRAGGGVAVSVTQTREIAEKFLALASAQQASELHQLLLYSGLALAGMALVSLLLGWVVAGRILRPVREINSAARSISAESLHRRLPLDGPDDEFKELGATLNRMLERLDSAFESQRRFVANASHELRTPLAVERTLLQVELADPDISLESLRATCEKLLRSGADQERLIEALLALASSDRGLEERQPVDLAQVVREALTLPLRAEVERRGLRLTADLAGAPTLGDEALLLRLASNLLENATRHNQPAGWLRVEAGRRGGRSFIAVSNSGPRILESEIDRLLQPFERLVRARTGNQGGHGLGLALVQSIARAHQAELTLTARPEGGIDVRVSFPASVPPALPDRGLERVVAGSSTPLT